MSGALISIGETEADLLGVATKFCAEKAPIEAVRRWIDDAQGFESALWAEIVSLGWTSILVPEDAGGLGMELGATIPVVEQMGRRLLAAPFTAVTASTALLVRVGGGEALLPRIAAGEIVTAAPLSTPFMVKDGTLSGTVGLILWGEAADVILAAVEDGNRLSLIAIETKALGTGALKRESLIDDTRRSASLTLDRFDDFTVIGALDADVVGAHQLDRALLEAADMTGGARAAVDVAVGYAQDRVQFGRPIGSYQAIKHGLVDVHIGAEKARSHLYSAAHLYGTGEGEVSARMAVVQAVKAASEAADRAIQFHGGFGFTYDCDAQLYRRRAMLGAALAGDVRQHRQRLAELLLDE